MNYIKILDSTQTILFKDSEVSGLHPLMHKHDECEITLIKSGSGKFYLADDIYNFRAGDVFFIDAKSPHCIKPALSNAMSTEEGVKFCSLYFNPRGNLSSLFKLPEMRRSQPYSGIYKSGFKVPDDYLEIIRIKLKDLKGLSGLHLLNKFILMMSLLTEMKKTVYTRELKYVNSFVSAGCKRIQPVLEYVRKNYKKNITLQQVADMVHLTTPSFCREFKKVTGKNLISYVHELRIEEVCRYLLDEKNSDYIVDMAYKAGFNSVTSFNRTFKMIKGVAPSEYKKEYRLTRVG